MEMSTSNAYINPHGNTTTRKHIKKRRRAVKNAIIRIDDVTELPGDNYCKWIKITKEKLAERESKLMSLRANILQTLICQQVEEFKAVNSRMKIFIDLKLYENIMNDELIDNCLNKLKNKLLNPWNGIVLNHSKNKFDSYRKYFTTSRSWFDQRKRTVLAKYLWIPLFNTLQEFIKIAAKRYFNERFIGLQSLFAKSLKLQIITNIFKQKIKLPSTRPHSLISCSILKECHAFQLYLKTHIAQNISVNHLLQKNPDMSAVTLMNLVIEELKAISYRSNTNFQQEVYELYDEFNFTPVYVEPLSDYSGNINNLNRNLNNLNLSQNEQKQPQIINNSADYNNNNSSIDMNNSNSTNYFDNISVISSNNLNVNDLFVAEMDAIINDNESQYNNYGPYHGQTYSVINERFSPLI